MAHQSSALTHSTLTDRLVERIQQNGPITFHDWMRTALYDPSEGYYCRTDRKCWGKEGDYLTSPQTSELFAATFARYFAELYHKLDRPSRWTIVEAGAGDGAFAEGVLSTLRDEFSDIFRATTYVIDEVSSASSALIAKRLVEFAKTVEVQSLDSLGTLGDGIVFANELFDAFPVHLVTCAEGTLQELYVDLDASTSFRLVPGPISSDNLAKFCATNQIVPMDGQVMELNLEVDRWLTHAATLVKRGYIVIVDYGAEAEELQSRRNGTLRGFEKHQFVEELLSKPGEIDLTTTINWTQVRERSHHLQLEVVDFRAQDKFLLQEGALVELQIRLDQTKSDAERLRLTTAARDLILPGGMSSSFQVLILKR